MCELWRNKTIILSFQLEALELKRVHHFYIPCAPLTHFFTPLTNTEIRNTLRRKGRGPFHFRILGPGLEVTKPRCKIQICYLVAIFMVQFPFLENKHDTSFQSLRINKITHVNTVCK